MKSGIEVGNLCDIPVRFKCVLCKLVLREPLQLDCGHLVCSPCIRRLKEKVPCQFCRNEGEEGWVDKEHSYLDKATSKDLIKLKVRCPNDPDCQETMLLEALERHLKICEHRKVSCELCEDKIVGEKMQEHMKECPMRDETCPKCKNLVVVSRMDEHRAQECPGVRQPCPYCLQLIADEEGALEEHALKECPVGWHPEKPCPYGCTDVENILEHRTDVSALATHVDRLRCLQIQGRRHKEPVSHCTESSEEEGVVEMVEKYGKLILEETKAKIALEKNFQELVRTLAYKDLQIRDLERRVTVCESSSTDGRLLWRISGIHRRVDEAKEGKTLSFYSPPFYTDRYGYKVCARMYLNGDGAGKGSHVSLYFVVMRGDFDPLLTWPFSKKVTMIAKDQNHKEDVMDAFRPDAASSSFKRPHTDMNIASGFPLFMPISEFLDVNKGYVKEDTAFINIIVDGS